MGQSGKAGARTTTPPPGAVRPVSAGPTPPPLRQEVRKPVAAASSQKQPKKGFSPLPFVSYTGPQQVSSASSGLPGRGAQPRASSAGAQKSLRWQSAPVPRGQVISAS